jgi:pimeloyl-ACP methyl ester carboxylesterase
MPIDIPTRFGLLRAWQKGPSEGRLVLGIHGLTGMHEQVAKIGTHLGSQGLRFVSLDLRGRGSSDRTPPGTYGWDNHALDVVAVADALAVDRFSIVGVSMGASVAMKAAELANDRVAAVVLVDVAGRVDPGIGPVVAQALAAVDPASADPAAVTEDRAYTVTQDPYARWQHLTMPTLLLRATREVRPGSGYVVPTVDRDRFANTVDTATIVEVNATHLTIADHPATATAIAEFLSRFAG